jgi:hypothetical protein
MIYSPDPRVIRTTVAFIAIVVGIALTSGRASATCGDYISIVGQSPANYQQDHMPVTATGESQGDPKESRAPCHGPGCSNSPTDSIPPITAPIGSEPKDPPAALTGSDSGNGGMSREQYPTSTGRAIRLPNLIFHPPRAV